jgi:hypothetical protein
MNCGHAYCELYTKLFVLNTLDGKYNNIRSMADFGGANQTSRLKFGC